jgi:hypothetical protein
MTRIAIWLLMTWRVSASLLSTRGLNDSDPWVRLALSPTEAAFIDSSRIESTTSGGQRVWLQFDFRTVQHGKSTNLAYQHVRIHTEVVCATRRAMDLSFTLYDANGIPVSNEDFKAPAWQPFDAPGLGPHIYDPLCAWLAGHSY